MHGRIQKMTEWTFTGVDAQYHVAIVTNSGTVIIALDLIASLWL